MGKSEGMGSNIDFYPSQPQLEVDQCSLPAGIVPQNDQIDPNELSNNEFVNHQGRETHFTSFGNLGVPSNAPIEGI